MSAAIVLVALVPVAIAGLLAGPIAAQALYIGIVLMSSVVRSLGGREQLLAAVFAGLVSTLGASEVVKVNGASGSQAAGS